MDSRIQILMRKLVYEVIHKGFGSDLMRYMKKRMEEIGEEKLNEYENQRIDYIFDVK